MRDSGWIPSSAQDNWTILFHLLLQLPLGISFSCHLWLCLASSQQVIQDAVLERSSKNNNFALSSKCSLFSWEVEILGNTLFFNSNSASIPNNFEVWKSWMRLLEYHQISSKHIINQQSVSCEGSWSVIQQAHTTKLNTSKMLRNYLQTGMCTLGCATYLLTPMTSVPFPGTGSPHHLTTKQLSLA